MLTVSSYQITLPLVYYSSDDVTCFSEWSQGSVQNTVPTDSDDIARV